MPNINPKKLYNLREIGELLGYRDPRTSAWYMWRRKNFEDPQETIGEGFATRFYWSGEQVQRILKKWGSVVRKRVER